MDGYWLAYRTDTVQAIPGLYILVKKGTQPNGETHDSREGAVILHSLHNLFITVFALKHSLTLVYAYGTAAVYIM